MRRPFALLAAFCLLPAALLAQEPGRARVVTGVEMYNIKFETGSGSSTTIRELVAPLGFSLPVGQRLNFELGTYFVNVEMDNGTSTTTISGLTDVIMRAAYQLKPDVATLTFSVTAPTGQTQFTDQQLSIAGNVSSDLIPFPVTTFGAGFSATTGLAVAVPAGSWAIGLAGAYRYSGEYSPKQTNPDTSLTPGSEFRLRLGADRLIGQGRFSVGVTYSSFTQDEFGAARSTPGPRIISQLGWGFPIGNSSLSLYAWNVYRAEGDSVPPLPRIQENTFAFGTVGAFRLGGNLLRPSLEFRMQTSRINGTDSDGNLIGAGLKYQIQAGRRMTIVPGVRADVGTSQNVDFTGISGSLSLRIGL